MYRSFWVLLTQILNHIFILSLSFHFLNSSLRSMKGVNYVLTSFLIPANSFQQIFDFFDVVFALNFVMKCWNK